MFCLPAHALDGSKSLAQDVHRIWGLEEGLFQPTVYSILQTHDGVLWLGTQDSLIRFDGLHFREFDDSAQAPLHRSLVRDLAEDTEGNLWVASVGGGLVRVSSDGSSVHYTKKDGLPSTDVFCAVTDAGGTVWACTNQGLARFDGHSFHVFSTADGLPSNAVRSTCVAPNGTRWVAGLDFGLARSVDNRFVAFHDAQIPAQASSTALQCGRDGTVWMGTEAGLVRIAASGVTLISTADGLPDNDVLSLRQAQDGTLWIGTNSGITRWQNNKISVYRTRDGLSHSSVLSLFEDREGTLWAGTRDGLDQFADGKVTPYTRHEGLSSDDIGPVLEGANHEGANHEGANHEGANHGDTNLEEASQKSQNRRLWIGTLGRGLNIYENSRFRTLTTADGLVDNTILSLTLDRAGDLWIGTRRGLNRWRRGHIDGAFDRGHGLSGNEIRSVFSDADGTLWVGTENGLDRWSGDRFVRSDRLFGEESLGGVLALGSGRIARLLVSTEAQGVFALRGGIASHANADLSRPVDCYFHDQKHGETWMGTLGAGLVRYRNQVFTHIRVKDGLYDNRIYGIVQDSRENLWFASSKGIFRISRQQLDNFADGKINYVTSLPFSTGQLRFECQSGVQPAATRTADGRLWFSTNNGLVMIDPDHLSTNAVPPPVHLTGVLVNGRPVKLEGASQLQLSAFERNIEIRYAGLSFITPERVTFRYILRGYENNWTDAGSRRVAFFTNLPPGPFDFQVSARNADGVWSVQPATFHFYVTPRLYQRVWFFPVLIVFIALFVVLLYRMRVNSLRHNFSILISERSRIARELHDTLLQGLSGITMQLQALCNSMPPGKEKTLLLGIIADAGRSAREARRSLWGLRGLDADPDDLSARLGKLAREAVGNRCGLALHLQPVALRPETEYQLLRIAAEAISNALKHAEACQITVTLALESNSLCLSIKDDGVGFSATGAKPFGHYGLVGMEERAKEVGACLEINSSPGQGTTIALRMNLTDAGRKSESTPDSQIAHHIR